MATGLWISCFRMANSMATPAASAARLTIRNSHNTSSSGPFPVSQLKPAGNNTPSGEVKLWTRSPGVKTRPWPVARLRLTRKVIQ